MPPPERPSQFQGPPITGEETRKRLIEDMDLDITASTASVLEGITQEKRQGSLTLAQQIAYETFSDVADVNRPFVVMISQ